MGDQRVVIDLTLSEEEEEEFECPVCLDTLPKGDRFKIPGCGHILCTGCAHDYVSLQIDEKAFPLTCPMSRCECKLTSVFLSSVLPEQTRERLERFLLAHALESDPAWRPCLTPDCKNGVFWDGGDVPVEWRCSQCTRRYCLTCQQPAHEGPCQLEISDDEVEEEVVIKKCPSCRVATQKETGCNYLLCSNCKTAWCWNCAKSHNDCNCGRNEHKFFPHLFGMDPFNQVNAQPQHAYALPFQFAPAIGMPHFPNPFNIGGPAAVPLAPHQIVYRRNHIPDLADNHMRGIRRRAVDAQLQRHQQQFQQLVEDKHNNGKDSDSDVGSESEDSEDESTSVEVHFNEFTFRNIFDGEEFHLEHNGRVNNANVNPNLGPDPRPQPYVPLQAQMPQIVPPVPMPMHMFDFNIPHPIHYHHHNIHMQIQQAHQLHHQAFQQFQQLDMNPLMNPTHAQFQQHVRHIPHM